MANTETQIFVDCLKNGDSVWKLPIHGSIYSLVKASPTEFRTEYVTFEL